MRTSIRISFCVTFSISKYTHAKQGPIRKPWAHTHIGTRTHTHTHTLSWCISLIQQMLLSTIQCWEIQTDLLNTSMLTFTSQNLSWMRLVLRLMAASLSIDLVLNMKGNRMNQRKTDYGMFWRKRERCVLLENAKMAWLPGLLCGC